MSIFDFSYEFPSTIKELDKFSGKSFEVFLFQFFKALGHDVRLTDDTNDKGIDLIVEMGEGKDNKRVGIQAKRWKSKVGANEIRSMLDGRAHYRLDDVWIVTTSDLTSAAITTAMNNNIEIINRDRVKQFLDELKKLDNIKFKEVKPVQKKEKRVVQKQPVANALIDDFKKLRTSLAQKHNINPVYLIYNNKTIENIIAANPKNIEELKKVIGFAEKNADLFGEEILSLLSLNKIDVELIKELEVLRERIVGFNKLENNDAAFNDQALKEIAEKMPTTLEELKDIEGLTKKSIDLFGDYLARALYSIKNKK